MKKYVLVTGASGGIGKAVAEYLAANGYHVFGTFHSMPQQSHDSIEALQMNVTSRESVEKAYAEVSEKTDHLEGIINIAGAMYMGSLIEEPAETMKRILDINVYGMCLVNEVFFPLIEKGHGRIINCSSEYGTYATVPFNAFYTASKHAVECYSDGLRRELRYLGIPVVTIRPGAFKTKMETGTADAFATICAKTTHYKRNLDKITPMLVNGTKNAKDTSVIAKVVYEAMTAEKPKRVYKSNHNLAVKFMSILPQGMIDTIFYCMFR